MLDLNTPATQKFIVKFFPEIMVKGKRAKNQMINQLNGNICKTLNSISKDITSKKFFDKIEIVTPIRYVDTVKDLLLKTPGVELVLEALQFDNQETIEDVKRTVNQIIGQEINGKTFIVRAKRTGEHDFKSPQLEREVGSYLYANNEPTGVDMKNPEITINIELVHKQLNIITHKHRGLGGFPIGTQGDILSLMSGGFDSTVASYLMMKRGVKTHFVFFNLGGIAHEIGVKQVALYLWNNFGSSHEVNFVSIPFEDVVTEIFKSVSEPYMGVMLKRLMLQAAEQIADDMKIDALLTGESIAQVSSQTLRNLALIDQATSKLVLRPLSTMNKPEIMQIAQDIGTKRFAETMPEYCGVISKAPVTHGSYDRTQKEANAFNQEVLNESVKNASITNIKDIVNDIKEIGKIDTVDDLSTGDYTVVDIRQSEECIGVDCETLKIPFYNLKSEFEKLPKDKEYLFYCDKGILSQLHAQYLKDQYGLDNIKVYRPE